MTNNSNNASQDPVQLPSVGRRPYQKPAFTTESVFETMALACGKILGQGQDQCRRVASNS